VSRAPVLVAAVTTLVLSCAPSVIVRPGNVAKPTVWSIRSDAAGIVLVGAMTHWLPMPLERHGQVFELALDLAPGRYEYRLETRDPTGEYPIFPEGMERTEDGFGGENLVLRIR
jgi:hypothetical protein